MRASTYFISLGLVVLFGCAKGETIDDGNAGTGADDDNGPGPGPGPGSGASGAQGGQAQGAGGPGPSSGGNGTGAQGSGGSANMSSSSTGMTCSEDPCKLVSPQCGCTAPRACSLDIANAALPRICTNAGTKAVGETCVPGECAAGSLCFLSVCTKYCEAASDCGGSLCFPLLDATDMPLASDANLCSKNCELVASSGCGAGQGCSAGTDPISMSNFSICRQAGLGGDLDDCSVNFDRDCAAGFGCFTTTSDVCLKWCRVGQSDCASIAGTTCVALNPAFVLNNVTYGVCN